ncbi:MAG: hypothetical protein PHV36_03000 [Elusimicrobiales bacterium]|nr:hypothetical protein [Elusimicrobiales bacterium]
MDENSAMAIAGRLGGQGGAGTLFGMTPWGMLASLLFSLIGYIYFKRGREQSDTNKLVCGIAMMLYPYFVTNALYITLIGAALMAAPYISERYF